MNLHTIDTGFFKLDGGAMFGVVPKSMWQKLNPPDPNNMCTWAMRCLIIEEGNRLILIDTGMGTKQDDKFRSHFQPFGEANIVGSIKSKGYDIQDITDVILTHLHFDHCGGAVCNDRTGAAQLQFPNAKYWSHSQHWQWATHPNAREKASFLKENIQPIQDLGALHFLDQEDFGADFIEFDHVFGHTEAMTVPTIHTPKGSVVFAADLMPSSFHIPMAYVMGYDIRPLDTLDEREKLYKRCLEKNHFILFEHDPVSEIGNLKTNDSGRVILDQTATVSDIFG